MKLLKRSHESEEFIRINRLGLHNAQDALKYLLFRFEKTINVSKLPKKLEFRENCLEHRLDRRSTSYNLDKQDNIKILLAVSGAGKTRTLLELLHHNFGYYFVINSSESDFGSADMHSCRVQCDKDPANAAAYINLLYFVRVSVCNELIRLGYNKPGDILYAQLHPLSFFGKDVFAVLYDDLLVDTMHMYKGLEEAFPFLVIDEIQRSIEGQHIHRLPESNNHRPFYSPLLYYTKKLGKFTSFIVAGTGINFEYIQELLGSAAMKPGQYFCHQTISNFDSLTPEFITDYSRTVLTERGCTEVEDVVSKINSFTLCHGRARFLAYIIDDYFSTNDIDLSMSSFMNNISNVESPIFPLRFL
ncbi:hypothetical protein BC833DRAFT_527981, partial [Globomyces pollinis-pini]